MQSKDVQEKAKKAKLEKYGSLNPPRSVDRAKTTNKKRYGKEWYFQTHEYRERVKETSLQKYGVAHHLSSEKQVSNAKKSLLEVRVSNLLSQYNIDFQQQYVISKNGTHTLLTFTYRSTRY